MERPCGSGVEPAASPSTRPSTTPCARRAATPVTSSAPYWVSASAPTPSTFPVRSWNGVAALRTTSMTREDFSSTTLAATHCP